MPDFTYDVAVNPLYYTPAPGPSGASAYSIAVQQGFVGSPSSWLSSLIGPSGSSAYQLWLAAGNSGSTDAFLSSLDGQSAFQLWVAQGNANDPSAFLASLIGPAGPSAYTIWQQSGHTGTTSDFLAALIGAAGPTGASAYAVAVANGFSGNQAAWLQSLVGPSGSTSYTSLTNKPTTFPPSAHTHPESDIINLVTDLSAKVPASRTLTTTGSVTGGGNLSGNLSISLVNDAASPGPSRLYGTDANSVKGFFPYGSAALRNVSPSGDAAAIQVVTGVDSRLIDSRTPKSHGTTHGFGGSDPVTIVKAQVSDFPGLATTGAPGLIPNLPSSNPATLYFRGDGSFSAVSVDGSNTNIPWANIINPPLVSASAPGLVTSLPGVSSTSGTQTQTYLRGDDSWQVVPGHVYTTAPFTIPAVNASTTVAVVPFAGWLKVGGTAYVSDGTSRGFLEFSAGSGATSLTLVNRNYAFSAPVGTTIASGAEVARIGPSLATSTVSGYLPPLSNVSSQVFLGTGSFGLTPLASLHGRIISFTL